jgi:hypothetical protein
MRLLAWIALALFVAVSPCFALSQTYQFVGTCDGGDMVYKWTIDGRTGAGGSTAAPALTNTPANLPFPNWPTPGQPGSSFMYPFTTYDILIHGVEILIVAPAPGAATPAITFLMSGNNYDGDTQVFLPAGQTHITHDFAPGHEFKFSGFQTGHETNFSYMDLHGTCAAGQVLNVMYTIYYIPDPASPATN